MRVCVLLYVGNMKVVHIACVAPPETGGIGAVAEQEVRSLRERGIDAVLLAPKRRHVSEQSSYIQRIASKFTIGHGAFLDEAQLRDACKDADIVHLHHPFHGTDITVARLKTRGYIRHLVITAHMDAVAPGLKGIIFSLYRMFVQRWVMRMADAVCVSSFDYAAHSSFKNICAHKEKNVCVEIPFGVDTARFHPAAQEETRQIVLFVGGMDTPHAFKGVDILLRAIVELPKTVECVLVGEGDLRPTYERLAEELGIRSRVRFLGRVSDAGLPMIYREAMIFVFPSTSMAEAFGLVAVEAQASGLPVIASDLPGVRTVVEHEKTGLLVSPKQPKELAQAIQRLLSDAELRRRLAASGREHVLQTYHWSTHVDTLIALYKKICASPS